MTAQIISQILLFAIALSMDAFAVSITSGLTYKDINKKKIFFIAATFGIMQALMPLLGFWLVEGISKIVGATGGDQAGKIMAITVSWIAFGLLIIIGGKMLIESILSLKKPPEEKVEKSFSIKEVLLYGVATSIDALGTGVAFHSGLSNTSTIWLHVVIIMCITFVISLIGLFLGKFFEKLLKGKYEITGMIGGIILLILAVWIIISFYIS